MGRKWNEYREVANISGNNIWITVDYEFAIHLHVGDMVMFLQEETGEESPWINTIELGEKRDIFHIQFEVIAREFDADGLYVKVKEK